MNLALDIALTHVRSRGRQTLVAIAGVATGVGFSIMMAALMQGSQDDFIRQLVNAMPHITVSDERRVPPQQPAETLFAAAEIHGLTPETRRRGVKNPLATMISLESWVPGNVAPSVNVQGIIRYASRDIGTTILGIDPQREPKVSDLVKQMRQGTLVSLYRATNAIILGDRLAEKIGAKIGANITVQTSESAHISAQVVGTFHAGVRSVDEGTAYVLVRTAQILAQQTGLVNELRMRVADPMAARDISQRVERETGYKSVSWQEAHEDLLSTFVVRNVIMYTIVGAILLVASFGTYNIISTITHEKARDIAIMKSLGLGERTVHTIFVTEALLIGFAGGLIGFGLGYLLCLALGSIEFKSPFLDANRIPLAYSASHYASAMFVGLASSFAAGFMPARKAARKSGRHHQGRDVTDDDIATASRLGKGAAPPLIEARGVTRILPGVVPTTLVRDINLEFGRNEFVAITGPSGSGKSSLLYLLGLLDMPTKGEVLIRTKATASMPEQQRAFTRLAELGFVFQFHFLLPEFSAHDNIMLPMRALGRLSREEMSERASSLLDSLGLGEHEHKRPDQLSGGQRQRVAVARALANDPPLILADEPTGSLDSTASEQVFEILRDLVDRRGKTVIAITHDLVLARRMDRRVQLLDGAIVSDDVQA
jgi:lipoprotein-releasing system permease protein